MPIERKSIVPTKRRSWEELREEHKKIGELLGLKKVPLHTLAWKEQRLELGDGDCYPFIDLLAKVAELLAKKRPRRKKSQEPEKME